MREFSKHLPHYLPLIGIFAFGIIGFAFFSYDRLFQTIVVISASLAYVFWGVIHHMVHKELYLSTIFEYISIAVIGAVIVISLILRA